MLEVLFLIKFRCGHCGRKLGVPDEYSGRRVRCTQCNEACQVPESGVLEDSAVALELDPEPAGDGEGNLRLRDEETAPEVWSNIDMGLSPNGEDELRAELIARARRPRGRTIKAAVTTQGPTNRRTEQQFGFFRNVKHKS